MSDEEAKSGQHETNILPASFWLSHGNRYPFDANDHWWKFGKVTGVPATMLTDDWALRAARGIMGNFMDRRVIGETVRNGIDEEVRAEVVETMAGIIRAAKSEEGAALVADYVARSREGR